MATEPHNSNHQGIGVSVRGLRKSFNGQEVLKGLDFEVNAGEIFVIMGPSGSGKSVLLKHIIGLEEPEAGEILIDGHSIQNPDVMDQYRLAMVSLTTATNFDEAVSRSSIARPAMILVPMVSK